MQIKTIRFASITRVFLLLFTLSSLPMASAQADQQAKKSDEWKPIESAMNRPGDIQPDGVLKFSMPRKDLKVTVAGTPVKAGLALGSWVAFDKPTGDHAMVMGDLVLTEDEVSPVMKKLLDGGVEVTALHNHVLRETPRVMYMHIGGMGDPLKLAQTIGSAVALTKTPPPDASPTAQGQEKLDIDTAQIEQILGYKGKAKGGVFQVGVPRSKQPSESMGDELSGGMRIPNSMGTATALNFQPTGDGKAAITGDFVLEGKEVQPVLKALRDGGVEVTALHSHMLNDMPRLFFMHFWANDDATKLARTLRTALDKTDSKKPEGK